MINNKKLSKNYDDVLNNGVELIKFYHENPCIAAHDLLGVDLAPIQRVVFEDMWFKNFVIVVAGRGGGKSVAVDSLSHIKEKGLVYLNEILPPIPTYLRNGAEEVIAWDGSVYTTNGFKPIKKLCLEKGINGKELRTQSGFINKGSNHHPLLVLDCDCNFVYKKMDEFRIGDKVCIQRDQGVFGDNIISSDEAYLIGLFIGDGHIKTKNAVGITTTDAYIKKFCVDYCLNNDVSFRVYNDKRTTNTSTIRFKKFDNFFTKYGINRVLSYYKSVPYSIRTATNKTQKMFLQGYFDTDGTVDRSKGGVSCCSVSKKLLQEIQLMLLNFGIVGKLRKKKTKSKFGKAYLLDIFSKDALKFKELIGFRLKRKQIVLDDYFDTKKLNVNKDVVPFALYLCYSITKHYHDVYITSKKPSFQIPSGKTKRTTNELTYELLHKFLVQCKRIEEAGFSLINVKNQIDKLKNILQYNYYFDEVVSVKDWKGDCYDFEMDMSNEPNYFANGFINHNTYMLGVLATLSCLLKPGYRVGLIGKVFRQCFFNDFDYLPIFTSKGLITDPIKFYDSIEYNTYIQSLNNTNIIKNKWINEEQEGLIIKTEKGFEIGGLYEHSVLTIDNNLDLVYKKLKDINTNDNLVIKKGFKLFGNDDSLPKFNFYSNKSHNECRIPSELTSDLSYWMGLIIGDGCILRYKKHSTLCFVNQDKDLIDSFKKQLITYFIDNDSKISDVVKNNTTHEVRYHGKKLFDFLIECGFTSTTALDKRIPDVVNKASKGCVSSFLSGLMDADGCVYVQQTKKSKSGTVHLSTSSLHMAKQVQAWFLNFGIMSNLSIDKKASKRKLNNRDKYSTCATSYKVRISNITDLKKFRDEIGFRCLYKKNILDDYLLNIDPVRCNNSNVVPNSNTIIKKLVKDCYKLFGYGDKEQNKFLGKLKNKCDWCSNISMGRVRALLNFAEKNKVFTEEYHKLKNLLDLDLNFVKPVSITKHTAKTIDIEVENESCYWVNGFINHNSKMIFSEVEKLYLQSSILQEACAKSPTRGSDSCYLKFKSVGGMTPSYIEALPLGDDGSKIRGSRFYLILIDELAQIPNQILDMVIRPMGATSLAPMERVRRIEHKNKLIEKGFATESDFEIETVNKMVMTSSGYYKFNHMWRRMNDYWRQTEIAKQTNTQSQFAVWQIPHWDLPEGFLDKNNIDEARRVMSNSEFRMEYEAAMVSDSEGFFKASLLEACTLGNNFGLETSGDKSSQYVLGVDPNQGGKASCGVIVIKLGLINKIVVISELKNQTTQQMTQAVQDVCESFNIVRVFMDRGGGGKAICDLLEDGYGNKTPLIDRTNEEHRHMQGRHVLEMVNFNPSWIADANFTTKAMFEEKKLLFPELSLNTTQDYEVLNYDNVNILKSQLLNIIVTPTSTGLLHFDTPQKGQNKDLYSALILAAHGVRILGKEMEEAQDPILFNSGGLVRMHKPGSSFDILDRASSVSANSLISAAVLKKKIK